MAKLLIMRSSESAVAEEAVLPVFRPSEVDLELVGRFLQEASTRGIWSNRGPLVRALEQKIGERLQVDGSLVCSAANGTQAIIGAISVFDLDRWVVPEFSFCATAHAVVAAGKTGIFGPVDLEDWSLTSTIPLAGPVGVLPVIPFGAPPDLEKWSQFDACVIDAAGSLGAFPNLGELRENQVVCFSSHATKSFSSVEGGFAVFGSHKLAEKFRTWHNFGFSGARVATLKGTNAKMSEVHAAFGLAALESWARQSIEWHQLRRKCQVTDIGVAVQYSPTHDPSNLSSYWIEHLPTLRDSDRIVQELKNLGIQTRHWWSFLPEEAPFSSFDRLDPHSLVAKRLASETLGFPYHLGLRDESIEKILEALSTLRAF